MRRIGLIIFLVVIVSTGGLVYHVLSSTGYFRSIENQFSGQVLKQIKLPGSEDMQVSYADHFLLVSSDDRARRRDSADVQGHLYFIDLRDTSLTPVELTTGLDFPFHPHGISMIKTSRNNYRVLAVNHFNQKHSIEEFRLRKGKLKHQKTWIDSSMVSPNDVVAIDKKRFYFTNDHRYLSGLGQIAEEYLGWAVSNVIHYNGKNYQEEANGIAYANGIQWDQRRQLLYVASPRGFHVRVYRIAKDGSLKFIDKIDCATGVDNIELDADGKLWIGGHPSLLDFVAYASGKRDIAPSEIIVIDYQDQDQYTVETVFLNEGTEMSAASVAVPYENLIFTGNVMDDHFLVLQAGREP